jgi:hypothetical protein
LEVVRPALALWGRRALGVRDAASKKSGKVAIRVAAGPKESNTSVAFRLRIVLELLRSSLKGTFALLRARIGWVMNPGVAVGVGPAKKVVDLRK